MDIHYEMKEFLQTADETTDFDIAAEKTFYVLKELAAGHEDRVDGREILKALPVDAIRRGELNALTKESIYVNVRGEYFPDLIEENGIYLASEKLVDYLKTKIALRDIQYNMVILGSEDGKRPEMYYLLIPDELDCAVKDSARYNKQGALEFMEIDEAGTSVLPLFKVKGFPHLIITTKVNRIAFTGVECVRIENYFHYETERDRLYRERMSGKRLQERIDAYERMADATDDTNYKFTLRRLLNRESLRIEIRKGLESIFVALQGQTSTMEALPDGLPSDRLMVLFWSRENGWFQLMTDGDGYFDGNSFMIDSLEPVQSYITQLPENLAKAAGEVYGETILQLACTESQCLDKHPELLNGKSFRLYMQEESSQSMNPPLIYDYKGPLQCQGEMAVDLYGKSFGGADLQEFDFSGKPLSGLKIEGSDLRRAKFVNCVLNGVEFINCDLSGADFTKSSLWKAKFNGCLLERTIFDGADLQQAEFGDSFLMNCSFIQSNLTAAHFSGHILTDCLFHKADMGDARFEIADALLDNAFRLCNLQKAKFTGKAEETEITGCEFRNCDLTEAHFEVSRIVDSIFLKSKLNMADFSGCESISDCDFRWSSFFRASIEGVWLESCDFSLGNLSQLKKMSEAIFCDNNFFKANLSGYDFGTTGSRCPNMLMEANLSYARLDGVDLSGCEVIRADFSGAYLKDTVFLSRQLEDIKLTLPQRGEIRVIRESTVEEGAGLKKDLTTESTESSTPA
ncbi:MAG TPA: hypothetical protein DDW50_01140 [Firmicutes bacterium]|jgi:uncharacterized protein YjbI with pentapeptide repeats|nr:hypothetical protein [Bacillota bacterium]